VGKNTSAKSAAVGRHRRALLRSEKEPEELIVHYGDRTKTTAIEIRCDLRKRPAERPLPQPLGRD
jgi:hypothetical protein